MVFKIILAFLVGSGTFILGCLAIGYLLIGMSKLTNYLASKNWTIIKWIDKIVYTLLTIILSLILSMGMIGLGFNILSMF